MQREIKQGQRYRHFKGNIYIVLAVAKHSESLEDMVVYQDEKFPDKIWVRPLAMFNEEVDHEKYPEVKEQYRFTRI